MFTGEWSQRSVLTTFTQEPRRIRVVNAKLAVSLLLGGGAAVFGGLVTAAGLGAGAASGRALEANLTAGAIAGYLLFVLLNVLAGVALGALLQNSATAIAACFALPAAFALLGTASTLVSDWIDMSIWKRVLENDWAGHVPQISFSVTLLGGGPARRRHRSDDTSRRRVAGSAEPSRLRCPRGLNPPCFLPHRAGWAENAWALSAPSLRASGRYRTA